MRGHFVAAARSAMVLMLAATVLGGPPLAAQEQRPPLHAGRVTGEILVGAYAGIGGFFIGRYVGEGLSDLARISDEDRRRRIGAVSGYLAAGLATAGTVYAIGNIGDETGEFDATALGTSVGFVAALAIARVTFGPNDGTERKMGGKARWVTINALAMLPAIGATVGFNSTRRNR
jgi:hypothetical protein